MELLEVKTDILDRALRDLPQSMDSLEARALLLKIGLQESRFKHTRQIINTSKGPRPLGPAKSYWQAEEGGGMITGVMTHAKTRALVSMLLAKHNVSPTPRAVWNAIEHNQVLACSLARLLLFTHPFRLPAITDQGGSWKYYVDTWRPGRPHPETWPEFHQQVVEFLS